MTDKKLTYSEKLRNPRWQRKRLEIWDRAGNKCENCNDSEFEMHVHHKWYERGREPWEYPNEALALLCSECHKQAQVTKLLMDKLVGTMTIEQQDSIVFFFAENEHFYDVTPEQVWNFLIDILNNDRNFRNLFISKVRTGFVPTPV